MMLSNASPSVKVGGVGLLNCCHDRWTVRGKLPSLSAEHKRWEICHLHIKMVNNYVLNSLLPHYMIWLYWITNMSENIIKLNILFYYVFISNFYGRKGEIDLLFYNRLFHIQLPRQAELTFKWIFAKWQYSSVFKYLCFQVS